MTQAVPTVYVIDDDLAVRKGLARLIKSVGLNVEVFSGSEEFLNYKTLSNRVCLIIDVCMPGINGIELQKELVRRGDSLPCILMSGNGDISLSEQAKKCGAVDVLAKPFDDVQLLHAIEKAVQGQG